MKEPHPTGLFLAGVVLVQYSLTAAETHAGRKAKAVMDGPYYIPQAELIVRT